MVKKAFKLSLRVTTKAIKTGLWVAGISSLVFLAPHAHRFFLRHYVGSKVVMIAGANPETTQRYGGGTGYHVTAPSGKTYIMTNRHVCEISKYMKTDGYLWAAVRGSTPYKKVKIIAMSSLTDLCIVEPLPDITGLHVGDEPWIGQTVAVIGHPNLQPKTVTLGEVVGRESTTMALGIIGVDMNKKECSDRPNSHIERFVEEISSKIPFYLRDPQTGTNKKARVVEYCVEKYNTLITTAMSYKGSSGSPLVDFWGNVVGTVFAIGGDRIWARVIPVTEVIYFLKDW